MAETKLPITGIIHTKDSAEDISEALQSLDFCCEILVADMESQDDTVELALEAGAQVIPVPDHQYADPVRQQIINLASQQWVFVLDADERVPHSLRMLIPQLIADSSVAAYAIPRKNILFGSWLSHTGWWPDPQIRLFQKELITWPATIHTHPSVNGLVQSLPTQKEYAIEHYNYRSTTAFIERMNRYSTIELSRASAQRPETALFQFISEYVARSIAKEGWKDGAAGLAASLLQSMYAGVVNIKSWEKHRQDEDIATDVPLFLKNLAFTRKELLYWEASLQIELRTGLAKYWWQLRRKFRI